MNPDTDFHDNAPAYAARHALADTKPTTLAGVAALLAYMLKQESGFCFQFDDTLGFVYPNRDGIPHLPADDDDKALAVDAGWRMLRTLASAIDKIATVRDAS